MLVQVILIFPLLIHFANSIEGPHVCTKEIERSTIKAVPDKIPFIVYRRVLCLGWPPKIICTKKFTDYRDGYKNITVTEKVKVRSCCEGFSEKNRKCIPLCSIQCLHGICVEPDVCLCQPGWAGSNCNISHTCPEGRKGPMCEGVCDCKNEARCNPIDGQCYCKPGWMGQDCSYPCPENRYGPHCLNNCTCQNNAKCDHITGKCKCLYGFKGEFCEETCESNSVDCETCTCKHGSCDEKGICICKPGYTGTICNSPCPSGTYGNFCRERCNCSLDTFFCDHIKGCMSRSLSYIPENNARIHDSSTNWAGPAMVFLSGALLGLFILFLIYRRKLKKTLKNLKLEVIYIAKEDPTKKFENPLYAFTPCEKNIGPYPNKLNNIRNDLGTLKDNEDKNMVCNITLNPSFLSGVQSSKRINYNPNIFKDGEDDKSLNDGKDNIYDEIKCKDDSEDDGYYDRPRPLSKVNNYETLDSAKG